MQDEDYLNVTKGWPFLKKGIKISKHLNPNIEAIDDGDIIKVSTVWDKCELHSCRHTIEALPKQVAKRKDASPPKQWLSTLGRRITRECSRDML